MIASGGGRRLLWWLSAAAATLLAVCILHAWPPGHDPAGSICSLRRGFGISCPTCGLTRAFAELAKGNLAGANRMHPLAPPLAIELALAWMAWGIAIARPAWAIPRRALFLAAALNFAALIALWIFRLATGTLPP